MNSSMAELRLVKPMVESSNLSSSAMFIKCECDEAEESWRSVKPLPSGLVGLNPSTHTRRESGWSRVLS